jgi:predicted DCC family thiol-disulfide oxidoreductase YuxK
VNTEITDNTDKTGGLIYYDATCSFCSGWAGALEHLLARWDFTFAPLETASDEMVVEFFDGRRYGGADAILAIVSSVWWLRPLTLPAKLPGVMPLLRMMYRFIAARRHSLGNSCRVPRRSSNLRDYLPLFVLTGLVIAGRNLVADWLFMCLLALSVVFGFKWLTWRRADRSKASRHRSVLYLFFWPGMNAPEFLGTAAARVVAGEWVLAAGKTLCGVALLALAASGRVGHALLAGWIGIAGALLLLHFGLFHLLSLIYWSRGIPALPLMRTPLLATSLADFWSHRWNRAFNKLAHDFLLRPLARRAGTTYAGLSAFIASGLVHDLVISIPARGGYGLPTAYFALQGAAVLFEKSSVGTALGLRRGMRGWLFTLAVTLLPAPLVFHTAFVHRIVLPILQVIAGLWGRA